MKMAWVAAGALAFAMTLGTDVGAAAGAEAETPTFDVRWGQQTWEEMQYTGVTYRVKESNER